MSRKWADGPTETLIACFIEVVKIDDAIEVWSTNWGIGIWYNSLSAGRDLGCQPFLWSVEIDRSPTPTCQPAIIYNQSYQLLNEGNLVQASEFKTGKICSSRTVLVARLSALKRGTLTERGQIDWETATKATRVDEASWLAAIDSFIENQARYLSRLPRTCGKSCA